MSGCIKDSIVPTPEHKLYEYLGPEQDDKAGKRYGGLGYSVLIKHVWRRFGEQWARLRLQLMEHEGKVQFSGRGRNRSVHLTEDGYKKAVADCKRRGRERE